MREVTLLSWISHMRRYACSSFQAARISAAETIDIWLLLLLLLLLSKALYSLTMK